MVSVKKERTIKTEHVRSCDNPLLEARALYDRFVVMYGNNLILDQAVRMVTHVVKNEEEDFQVLEKMWDSLKLSDCVENACLKVARIERTDESRAKADLVRDIRTYLYDCV